MHLLSHIASGHACCTYSCDFCRSRSDARSASTQWATQRLQSATSQQCQRSAPHGSISSHRDLSSHVTFLPQRPQTWLRGPVAFSPRSRSTEFRGQWRRRRCSSSTTRLTSTPSMQRRSQLPSRTENSGDVAATSSGSPSRPENSGDAAESGSINQRSGEHTSCATESGEHTSCATESVEHSSCATGAQRPDFEETVETHRFSSWTRLLTRPLLCIP